MSITRWQPQHPVERVPHLIDLILDMPFSLPAHELLSTSWLPETDIREEGDRYIVTMSLPGFNPEDIKVEAFGTNLTVSATLNEELERDDDGQRWWVRERRIGNVRRTVNLPEEIEVQQARCNYDDGVLEVIVPKGRTSRRRSIPVSSGKKRDRRGTLLPRLPVLNRVWPRTRRPAHAEGG